MTESRPPALLLVAATVLVLQACGGDADAPPPAAATDARQAASPAASTGDACTVLPAADVEAIVGMPVTDSLAMALPSDGSPITTSHCNYSSAGSPTLSLLLRRGSEGQSAHAASASVRETFAESGIEVEPVPFEAGEAFWGSNQLHVFGQGWYIIVTPDAAAGLAQARALAERAADRLEEGA